MITLTYTSARQLSLALQRAEAAHAKHEEQTGVKDPNWPDWYANFMAKEQDQPK